ncbi:MAG: anthranilate synthase component I family protein [Parachlamydia sp.]|nr:anthranilate synthase component I family protein [Parachlamydia sp.]
MPKRVIIFKEYTHKFLDPISAFLALKSEDEDCYFTEIREQEQLKYSYLCFIPQATFCTDGQRSNLTVAGNSMELHENGFEAMKRISNEWRCADIKGLPALIGGGVGFVSYDAIRHFEKIPARHPDTARVPDFFLQFHEKMILIDHKKQKVYLCIALMPGSKPADSQIDALADLVFASREYEPALPAQMADFEADASDAEYCAMVKKAQDYINAGDAFQIVLSRTFYKPCTLDPIMIYKSLKEINPSLCMFLIKVRDFYLIGASPERLVSATGRSLETMPIAGSRPRGVGEQDLLLEQELLADEKELAEHTMLVDLARNDLGSIAETGSVIVSEAMRVHRFSHIMHIVSKVKGFLKETLDPLDALKATFPAGTLTGAPKIRAMEIIDELEKSRRGIYGGVICTIDRLGNFDSFIAIRFIFLQNGIAQIRTGAGIVYDSVPLKEAEETRHKANAQMLAIKRAEGAYDSAHR